MAKIVSITIQPLAEEYGERLDYFIRVPRPEARLIAGHGIEGDRKAGRNRKRQINLLSQEWLAIQAAKGFKTAPGQFGEQLILAGLDFSTLKIGDRLIFDDAGSIEITQPRTGCGRLDLVQGRETAAEVGHIGLLAKVITNGLIQVGSVVTVLQAKQVD